MPGRTYYDFILHTEIVEWDASPGGRKIFSVNVFDSPAGQQSEAFRVEVDDYDNLQDRVIALEDRLYDGELALQRELGARLADLLLPKPARDFFISSLKRLKGSSEGLRLRLRLEPQLADLPWEFMYLPHSRQITGGFLALDPRLSIVRHEELPIPVDWPRPRPSLRIVLAMASPGPYGTYPKLTSLPTEQLSIKKSTQNIKGLEMVYLPKYARDDYPGKIPGVTLPQLTEALKTTTDVLQFSGHGEFIARSGRELDTEVGKSFIVVADGDNQADEIPAEQLACMVEGKGVRLLYLGACETAKRRPFKDAEGFTCEVLKHKLPCVLAMQFRVDDKLAAAFTSTLYQTLVAGWTVDEAVSQGRAAMVACGRQGQFALRDWCAPVLYSRIQGGDLFRPVLDEAARMQAERMAEQRARISQAWWRWNGRDNTLANSGQLGNLEKLDRKIELSPFQFLFLLRSAAKEWIPATPWLERIGRQAPEWLRRLDDPNEKTLKDLSEAMAILGLDTPAQTGRLDGVGRVAWSAVKGADQLTRQAAVLALVPFGPGEAQARLAAAFKAIKDNAMHKAAERQGWKQSIIRLWAGLKASRQRLERQSELAGTLAELDPGHAADYIGSLPPAGRVGARLWRFWRWFLQDLGHILILALGAGLAAGTLLGLQRLVAIFGGVRLGAYMGISFFYALVLAAAMAFGMGLSEATLLRRHADHARLPPFWRAPWHPDRRVDLLAVALGMLFFGTAHVVSAWVDGAFGNLQYPRGLMVLGGYLVGLGVSLGLYSMPKAGLRVGPGGWLARLAGAAASAVLAQLAVFASGQDWSALSLTYTGIDFSNLLGKFAALSQWITANARLVTLADAALVTILLVLGSSLGLAGAERLYRQWQLALHRAQLSQEVE